MLKILKNLKESIIAVIFIILLLFVQARADLSLPDYTSKIVNTGIQAGGIEKSLPEIIGKDDMDVLLMFSDDDNEITSSYTLVTNNLSDYQQKIIKKYFGKDKKVDEGSLYILNDISDDQQNSLAEKLVTPLLEVTAITNEETANKIKEQMMANVPDAQKPYIQSQSLREILVSMPEEQRNIILNQFSDQVNKMSDTIKTQAAIASVKQIYKNVNVDTDRLQNNYILMSGFQMLGVALISMVSAIIVMLLSNRVAAQLARTVREKVFEKVLSFSNGELINFSTSSLITRTTNDIQQIQQLMTMLFRVVVYAPVIGVGGLIKVFTNSDKSMAWIIGVAIFAILIIVGTLFIIVMPKFKKLQELTDKLNLVAREILSGLPVIRAFNTEKKEEKRFDVANVNLMNVNIFVNRVMSMMSPILTIIMNSIAVLIVWVGGHSVDQGLAQVGDVMAFIQYTMQIVMAFLMISVVSIMLPRASVSAGRINEVLETEPSIKDKNKDQLKKFDPSKKGLVEFKDVSFKYPDAETEILSDISFTAKPGETTAIIGSTGSGKSTVVNLIPRFYDVTGGEIRIDGVNIKDVSQKDLRDIIGFVPQKGVLFSGTIESNIKYSDENMSDERMIEAAEIAQATEFINTKEKKYKEEISQGGTNVSGGQRQRLSIARAIAKDPEIFVFDDSFSALDLKTDAALREALAKKTTNKTVIIVAQRISTILDANQIIVLEDGNVVGIGTHEELMKNNETYRQIALSQLSEEELNKKGGK